MLESSVPDIWSWSALSNPLLGNQNRPAPSCHWYVLVTARGVLLNTFFCVLGRLDSTPLRGIRGRCHLFVTKMFASRDDFGLAATRDRVPDQCNAEVLRATQNQASCRSRIWTDQVRAKWRRGSQEVVTQITGQISKESRGIRVPSKRQEAPTRSVKAVSTCVTAVTSGSAITGQNFRPSSWSHVGPPSVRPGS
jgi:hypothetical protein